jgi:hypothetical protein
LLHQKPKAIMKQKFLLSLVFVCTFIVSTRAQIGAGSLWLGGGIGFSQSKSDNTINQDQKTKSFNISPAVGKAIKENLIAGIRLGYSKNTQESGIANLNDYKTTSQSYGGGIFLRKYVPVVNRLYIFGEGTASYYQNKETRDEMYNSVKTSTESKGWSTGLSFTPGVSYGITKKLQLETGFNSLFSIGYGKSKSSRPNSPSGNKGTTELFSAGINLENESTFYLGFRILINNKG